MRRTAPRIAAELCQSGLAVGLFRRCGAMFGRSLQQRWSRQVPTSCAAETPLLEWGRRFLPHYFRRAPSALHRQLEQWWRDADRFRGLKLNVIGPRGGAKSTVGTLAWVLRSAVEAREPYIWIVSDTKQQAENHLESVKAELLDNAALASAYPAGSGRGPVWRRHFVELRNGCVIEALGTGQRMRGRRRRENRPTLIVCDDLQNDDHIVSAAQRERSDRWFHGTLLKAGSQRTNVVNLATALHRDALALQLHRTPGWTSKIFPAIVRWPDYLGLWEQWEAIYCDWERPDAKSAAQAFYESNRLAMESGAELLWPEEEGLYALMCMRIESGRAAFEREKQGSPANPDLSEWPESYFDRHIWFDEWPAKLAIKTLALDPSKGRDANHGDYSAFVLLGVAADGVMYVEADLARRPSPQIVADGVELYDRFQWTLFAGRRSLAFFSDRFAARACGRHDYRRGRRPNLERHRNGGSRLRRSVHLHGPHCWWSVTMHHCKAALCRTSS